MNPYDYIYNYKLLSYRVYDGDGLKDCVIDEGRHEYEGDIDIRLIGIDCPEVRKSYKSGIGALHVKAGKLVRDYLEELLKDRDVIWIRSHKKANAKYNRLLASLFADNLNVNQHLVSMGFAKEYDGGKKSEWTDRDLHNIIKQLSK